MKNYILTMIGILLLLPGCVYAVRVDGPYEGRVIDAETGAPIEGAVVLGAWSKEYLGPGGAVHEFYDAKETITDKNGEFSISGRGIEIMSNVAPMDVYIFKAGYEYIIQGPWESFKGDLLLKKKIRWEGSRAIIPLRKLTLEERKKKRPPARPPIPDNKMSTFTEEINKERMALGLEPLR
jgi:hypothetical protein